MSTDQTSTFRIALANIRFPATPEESVTLAEAAIAEGASEGAGLICFPECFVPGYRAPGKTVAPPDPAFRTRLVGCLTRSSEGKRRGSSRHRTRCR